MNYNKKSKTIKTCAVAVLEGIIVKKKLKTQCHLWATSKIHSLHESSPFSLCQFHFQQEQTNFPAKKKKETQNPKHFC